MSTINRAAIASALVPGVHEIVGLSYGDTPMEHAPMYDTLNSKRAFEEEVMYGGTGGAVQSGEGGAVTYDSIQELWTARYQHETYKLGLKFTKEAFDDDLYDVIGQAKGQELGTSMADTKQVKACATFNRGFNPAYAIGDGQALFSATHPMANGDTFSNLSSSELSESALEDICISISKMTNDRGILISARAESIHIPADLEFDIHRILKSESSVTPMTSTAGGATRVSNKNDVNVLRTSGKFPKGIFVNRRLNDPDAWYVRTSIPNGTKMFVREALQGSSDNNFDTDDLLIKYRERYSFGVTNPRQWFASAGS